MFLFYHTAVVSENSVQFNPDMMFFDDLILRLVRRNEFENMNWFGHWFFLCCVDFWTRYVETFPKMVLLMITDLAKFRSLHMIMQPLYIKKNHINLTRNGIPTVNTITLIFIYIFRANKFTILVKSTKLHTNFSGSLSRASQSGSTRIGFVLNGIILVFTSHVLS